MSVSPRFRLRTFAVATMALGLLAGSATVAAATYVEDPRAEVVDGNVDEGMKDACEKAGLAGEPLDKDDVEFTGGTQQDRFLTITEIPDGAEVTGIIVKGGDGYNLYVPGEKKLSATPPWKKLRAPLNNGGKIPQISHWFLCGEVTTPSSTTSPSETETSTSTTTESSTTSTETSTSSETTSPEESTTGVATSTTTSGAGGVATTTSQPAVSPAGDSGDLASTGFGSGWLIGLGALLLAGGGALLALTRMRRKTS
ncbi:hypothetical protein [Qaidamihabitans albus]|uniref:hypothetical protein n=1 Tax=Qaidamihabitans albus TaxID=2795733 RepID=UPI0018F1F42D|nr:hypothetical protein [Qaidamihabitans albus]